MFLTSVHFLESGVKASANPRPRKQTTRKTKAAGADLVQDEEVPAQAELPIAQNVQPAAAAAVISHQEESTVMSQTQSENVWQDDVQGGAEQYTEGYAEGTEADQYYDEESGYVDESSNSVGEQLGHNQIMLTLSYSLMNQVRQVARMEGVFPEDILIELIAEGVTRRAFEDAQRPAPSHLMTRTGYVAPDANGNVQQPQLSHHGMQGNQRGNHQGHNNRRFHNNNNNNNRGNHFQGRNRQNQFKNKPRNGK